MPESAEHPLLEVRHLSRRFPGVLALDQVDLSLQRGEVLAVVGENGAGKSTLMRILAGVDRPDSGEILLEGQPVEIDSVPTALEMGIALIHQELNLADNLDVGANIFLGREPRSAGLIDERRIAAESKTVLDALGVDLSPRTLVRTLSLGRQQMVEIAKALSTRARILIMDEPTSSLSKRETDALFRVVGQLRDSGVSVVYISHRLGEVKQMADRVLVLRDGRNAGELTGDEIKHDAMVRLMVGRDVAQFYNRRPHPAGRTVLEVEDLVVAANPEHRLSFSVRAGEIVSIAGLVGAGRSELLQTIFGADAPLAGTVRINGHKVSLRSPGDAIRAGVALVPEDRKASGLVLDMNVRQNISLAALWRHRIAGAFVNRRREEIDSARMVESLDVRTPSLDQTVRFLSGGNQQKVVLGKWLCERPKVLLLDEPTRGIDVGTKHDIYQLMDRLAGQGVAVLFASSEMEEILGMSDRTLVMHEGRIAGELARDQLSEEAVMRLATGGGVAA